MDKGEKAGNQPFLLFRQCFLPIKARNHHLTHYHTMPDFDA